MYKNAEDNRVFVDQISKIEWEQLLLEFDDATIYQTWSYGVIRWGRSNLSHMVLKQKGEIIAAAQLRIIKIPLLGAGIAYVTWGPLWRRRNQSITADIFRHVINALKEEYVIRRGLLLRIRPNVFKKESTDIISILDETGFKKNENAQPYRTLMLDLSSTANNIRKALDQKWRNQLNRAEKNNLIIQEGTGDELYHKFLILQKEMHERKKYIPGVDYDEFRKIQKDLPKTLKMIILICTFEEKVLSATICSMIGDTGIYLLGATGNEGMKTKGAYLSQWRIIEIMKASGCHFYDLGGIDPDDNPGVYHFKSGISRKEAYHIGQFEFCQNPLSSFFVNLIEKCKRLVHDISTNN
ncbi:MAG TPA: peptidoglycan bridge formation glycyltransferase FemA/FemB family protein [Smithella sp.]|nr:peptidoglycan bridge formation glycyltransferase FemA/FemB family protein [Smithella sp.]